MNKLDNKVIVDRQFTLELLDCLDVNDPDHGQVAQKLHEIMSVQDNTGWVATVAKPSESMLVESAGELPEYRPDDPEWDQLEYEIVSAERHMSAAIYRTMLNASPALFETKEKQNEQA